MNFNLSERELEVQKLARDFAQNEIAPVIGKYDESGEFPMEIAKKLGRCVERARPYYNACKQANEVIFYIFQILI